MIGFYGRRNFGDDLMGLSLISELKVNGYEDIRVFCDEPEFLKDADVTVVPRNVFQLVRQICLVDVLVQGGGTVFHDSYVGGALRRFWVNLGYYMCIFLFARAIGTKIILLGAGVGPIRHPISRFLCYQSLNCCSLVLARDKASETEAKSLLGKRTRVELGKDLAVLSPVVPIAQNSNTLGQIGFSICDLTPFVPLEDAETSWASMIEGVHEVLDSRPVSIRFYSLFTGKSGVNDAAVSRAWGSKLAAYDVTYCDYENDTYDFWEDFAESDVMIATRFHAVVAAYLSGLPFLAVSYNRKVRDFCSDVGIPDRWVLSLNESKSKAIWRQRLNEIFDLKHSSRPPREIRLRHTNMMSQSVKHAITPPTFTPGRE
jgi:polysaccharide pyruvyl transferase WcaK-like protein